MECYWWMSECLSQGAQATPTFMYILQACVASPKVGNFPYQLSVEKEHDSV